MERQLPSEQVLRRTVGERFSRAVHVGKSVVETLFRKTPRSKSEDGIMFFIITKTGGVSYFYPENPFKEKEEKIRDVTPTDH